MGTEKIKPLNLLTGMRELLTDPKRWTKGNFAKNGADIGISPLSSEATCFCLQGAAMKVAGLDLFGSHAERSMVREEYRAFSGHGSVVYFNDSEKTTHADILRFLDNRIEFHLKEQRRGAA